MLICGLKFGKRCEFMILLCWGTYQFDVGTVSCIGYVKEDLLYQVTFRPLKRAEILELYLLQIIDQIDSSITSSSILAWILSTQMTRSHHSQVHHPELLKF